VKDEIMRAALQRFTLPEPTCHGRFPNAGGDMKIVSESVRASTILTGCILAFGITRAQAQDPGLGGILGGYGAMAGASGSSMGGGFNIVDPSGMGGNAIVPAAGGLGVSMSPGMRGGGGLFFRSRPSTAFYSARPFFSLDSMGGGMTRMAGAMGMRRPFTLQPSTLTGGTGLGGIIRRMPAAGGMGVMPPSIGYPFRQPPSLVSPSTSGAGMSM
jgi:hypothetical protein